MFSPAAPSAVSTGSRASPQVLQHEPELFGRCSPCVGPKYIAFLRPSVTPDSTVTIGLVEPIRGTHVRTRGILRWSFFFFRPLVPHCWTLTITRERATATPRASVCNVAEVLSKTPPARWP